MTTTADAIYRDLLARLQAQLSIDDSHIWMAPFPIFNQHDRTCVQLVPGVPTAVTPQSGVGLVTEEFRVVIWTKVILDQNTVSTGRIADSTLGVLKLLSDVIVALVQYHGSADLFTYPVTYQRGATVTESDQHPNWIYAEATFMLGYQIADTVA